MDPSNAVKAKAKDNERRGQRDLVQQDVGGRRQTCNMGHWRQLEEEWSVGREEREEESQGARMAGEGI